MIGILVKNRLSALVGSMFSKGKGGAVSKASTAKKIFVISLAVILIAFFVASVVIMELGIAAILVPLGAGWLYYAVIMLATFTVGFVLSIFETKSELFECRDNELLLSMPIKASDILASRIIVTLIYNYAIDAIIMIPATVIYGVYAKELLGILGGVFVYLLMPLAGTSLASGVGFAVAKISKLFKNKTIISLVVSVAFLVLYFYAYTSLMSGFEDFLANIAENLDSLIKTAPILYYVGAVALLEPAPAIIFAAVCIVVALGAFFVISYNYIGLITAGDKGTRVKYKEKNLVGSGVLLSLIKKEFLHFTSSSTYMLNSGLGLIMPLIVGGIALFNMDKLGTELAGVLDVLTPMVAIGISLLVSMTYMSACSLSLEGASLWIIKSMPLSARTVILAKTLPQIILSAPVSIITGVLFAISLGVSPLYWVFVIMIPTVATVMFAFLGIIFNVLFPKFDYTSEAHVIKQSASATLTLFTQMAVSGAMIPLAVWFLNLGLPTIVQLIIFLAVYTVLAVVLAVIALMPCARKLSSMNV